MEPINKPEANPAELNAVDQCFALGEAAIASGQLLEAVKRFSQARILLNQCGGVDKERTKYCLERLLSIYSSRNMPQESLEIAGALRSEDDSLEHRRVYVNILYQIGANLEKDGERDRAEEAYGQALVEATNLLPATDPLIAQLNTACIEIFKTAFKSKRRSDPEHIQAIKSTVEARAVDSAKNASSPQARSQPQPQSQSSRTNSASPLRAFRSLFSEDSSKNRQSFSQGSKIQKALHSNVLIVVLSFLLFGSLARAALFAPSPEGGGGDVGIRKKIERQQFESCDKKSSFCILNDHQVSIKKPGFRLQCAYTLIENPMQDMVAMLKGYLTRDELWYQVGENEVMDPDRTLLYRQSAPELAVVKQMWWYADYAQKWFNNKHSYPTDAERCKNQDKGFEYINPFTFKQDCAAIVALKGRDDVRSWDFRPQTGAAAPSWRPGAISCISSDGTKFFIHGCDRSGYPLTASDPKHFYVIECRDGANMTRAKLLKDDKEPDTQLSSDFSNKPLRVFVYSRPEQEGTVRYFRSLTCALAWLWLIIAGLWCVSSYKLKQSAAIKGISILTTLIGFGFVLTWYLLATATGR